MDAKDSCIFRRNWLDAAHTITDPTLRCYFFEAVMQYAFDGMKMDVPKELDLALGIIYSLIDIDRDKYEKKIEKRREAGRLGGAPKGNQNARKNTEQPNQANGCLDKQNEQMLTNQANQADTDTATDTVTDTATDTATDVNNDYNNTPLPPKGARKGGESSFSGFFQRVKSVEVPGRVKEVGYDVQYVWRMVDGNPGYALAVKNAVERCESKDELTNEIYKLNSTFRAAGEFQAVKLAMAMGKLKTQAQVNAVVAEVDRSRAEEGIYKTMLDKVEYIAAGNKVKSLEGFMRSRQ